MLSLYNNNLRKSTCFLVNSLMNVSLARVAQSVERSAVNRKVGGSNPPVSEFLLFFYKLIDTII